MLLALVGCILSTYYAGTGVQVGKLSHYWSYIVLWVHKSNTVNSKVSIIHNIAVLAAQ